MNERALDEAIRRGLPVAVMFGAHWCADCVALDVALTAVPDVFRGLTCLRVELARDGGDDELLRRLAILELPTVVWIAPDGVERGRVVGFTDLAGWRRQLERVRRGEQTLEALAAHAPDDRAGALALAEALLSRDAEAGLSALARLAAAADDTAAEALHRQGRYLHRARNEPEAAIPLWQSLYERFESHPHAPKARAWHAAAHAALGAPERGAAVFEARHQSRPRDASNVLVWASFCAEHGLEEQRARVQRAAMQTLSYARGIKRDQLENLVMNLSAPFVTKPAS